MVKKYFEYFFEQAKKVPAEVYWNFGPPIFFLLITLIFFPIREQFQFDHDEGVNLIKALLVDQGYSLYSEIWSDQPPLFTFILASIIHYLGYRVGIARIVVLLFSAVLVWAATQYMRITFGKTIGFISFLLILVLPSFIVQSIAVMIGLPSISLAMVSLLCIGIWHKKRNPVMLGISAIALSLSVAIKLITGFLAPIIVIGILTGEVRGRSLPDKPAWIFVPSFLWGLLFMGATIIWFLLFVGPENFSQITVTHLGAREMGVLAGLSINSHLRNQVPLMILALLSAVYSYQKKNWYFLYPFAWMVTAYGLLFFHNPVWEHQQYLVTIPAAMLAAVSVYEIILKIPKWGTIQKYFLEHNFWFLLGFLAFFFLVFDVHIPDGYKKAKIFTGDSSEVLQISNQEARFLNDVSNFASQTNWMVTDVPMYAFITRLKVPPNLAVFTVKRLMTDNLTEDEIIQTIQTYKPEQILFGRREYRMVERSLAADYTLIREDILKQFDTVQKLYIRNDLVP